MQILRDRDGAIIRIQEHVHWLFHLSDSDIHSGLDRSPPLHHHISPHQSHSAQMHKMSQPHQQQKHSWIWLNARPGSFSTIIYIYSHYQ
jgi:hypothetical protein